MKKSSIPETEPKEIIFRPGVAKKYRLFIMAGLIPVIVFGLFLGINAFAGRNAVAGFIGSAKDAFFSLLWNAGETEKLLSVIDLPEEKNNFTASIADIVRGAPSAKVAPAVSEAKPSGVTEGAKPAIKKESSPAKPGETAKKPAAAKPEAVKPAECVAPFASAAGKTVILNEIAWAGAQGKASDEWIELKNVSAAAIKLSGWRIINQAETLKIIFDGSNEIPAGGFFLLERTDDDSVPGVKADKTFTGGIKNSDEKLMLLSQNCALADEVSSGAKWPAGDAAEYRSAERNGDYSWHSYSGAGAGGIMGTPKAANSVPPPPKPVIVPAPATPTEETDEENEVSQPAPPAPKFYKLVLALTGTENGSVKSEAEEIDCEDICSASFKENLEVKLVAHPASDSDFMGWGGACAGGALECVIKMSADKSASAEFKKKPAPEAPHQETPPEEEAPPAPEPEPQPAPEPEPASAGHLLISEVQITGGPGETNKEFIEIYNPTAVEIKLNGYRLVKRTKVGSIDISIKSWTNDASASVPAHGHYLWANSSFAAIYAPDASTTAILADDNGIALRLGPMDSGEIIDSLAWGEASNAFVEGVVFMENPGANKSLERESCPGAELCDSDNNMLDFHLNDAPSPRNSSPNQ